MLLCDSDISFIKSVTEDLKEYESLMESVKLRDALIKVLMISRKGNQYMQSNQPWVLVKGSSEDRVRAGTIIGVAANISCLLGVLMHPFMPKISDTIFGQCGISRLPFIPETPITFLPPGHVINKPKPLFVKIEKQQIDQLKSQFGGNVMASSQADISKGAKIMKNKLDKGHKLSRSEDKYPELNNNVQQIDKLLNTVELKYKQNRDLFVRARLKVMSEEKEKLRRQMNGLVNELVRLETIGHVKQIRNPASNNDNSAIKTEMGVDPECLLDGQESNNPITSEKTNKRERKSESKDKGKGIGQNSEVEEVDIGRLDIRVGRILKAEKHANADSLYVEQIDLGEQQPRTVVSGLARHVPLDQMQNRLVVCLCNLKPVKMRGVESAAMVLCASTPERVELLEVDSSCVPGQKVLCDGFKLRPDSVLNPKKKVWEAVAVDLKVNAEGMASYKGVQLKVDGKTPIIASTLKNVPVK
ncbi:hypothetical protein AB6A40_007970 [Gnathostoma spinigerum]|uniref:tRNA-binding domain-containing protein n=1 Tax=Gnathostoma spinigerum TaxID=75299 RepID=A0ABD6EN94_9BILA